MAHAVGKDEDGKYWFRSKQKLVDVTDALEFVVERGIIKKAFWPWQEDQYVWNVMAKFIKQTGFYRYPHTKKEWVDTTNKGPKEYKIVLLGSYDDEEDASTALECLMHMRDVKLIMF